jgi:hypothetical protein
MYILFFIFFYLNIQLSLILIQFRIQNVFGVKLIFRVHQICRMIDSFPWKVPIKLFGLTHWVNLIIIKLLHNKIHLDRCILFNYFQIFFCFQSLFPLILAFTVHFLLLFFFLLFTRVCFNYFYLYLFFYESLLLLSL